MLVSWGEIGVCVGLGLLLVGKKDLPKAAGFVGTQIGRVVGLLQGTRLRADQFASNNELKALQNELRAGLRELDAVKTELAVSMSPGRELGPTVPSANLPSSNITSGSSMRSSAALGRPNPNLTASTPGNDYAASKIDRSEIISTTTSTTPSMAPSEQRLAPPSQTIAAVAEAEWVNQGIQFNSKAEQGAGMVGMDTSQTGSSILSNLLQQSLIFDQYDRTVQEQDQVLQSKLSHFQQKANEAKRKAPKPKTGD